MKNEAKLYRSESNRMLCGVQPASRNILIRPDFDPSGMGACMLPRRFVSWRILSPRLSSFRPRARAQQYDVTHRRFSGKREKCSL